MNHQAPAGQLESATAHCQRFQFNLSLWWNDSVEFVGHKDRVLL